VINDKLVTDDCGVISVGRQHRRIASYELTLRADSDNAMLFVDVRQSPDDELVEVTLAEVTRGHVEVTFFARRAAAFWDVGDRVEKVSVRSKDMSVVDGDWHRIEITRYDLSSRVCRARCLSVCLSVTYRMSVCASDSPFVSG